MEIALCCVLSLGHRGRMLGVDCIVQTTIEHTRDACSFSRRIGSRRHFSSLADIIGEEDLALAGNYEEKKLAA